jgi:S-DNA-T family DNA segregation ATPase FtsK/SpoIIIE
VLGCNKAELRRAGLFLLGGLGTSFEGLKVLGSGAGRGAVRAAYIYRERRATRRVATAPRTYDADQAYDEDARFGAPKAQLRATPAPASKPGLLNRVPIIGARRAAPPAPELEPELYRPQMAGQDTVLAPSEDRVRQRIASAIQGRVKRDQSHAPQVDASPSAARTSTAQPPMFRSAARAEPVLSASRALVSDGAATGPRVTVFSTQDSAPFEQVVEDFDDPYSDRYDDPYDDTSQDMPQIIPAPVVVATPLPASGPGTMLNRRVVQQAVRKPAIPSRQAMAEAQPSLTFGDPVPAAYEPPPLSLLTSPSVVDRTVLSEDALEENARMLENVLDDYGVKGEIVSVRPGPVVTMYELEPAPGLKASRVIGLAEDIARSMSALSARVSTVPGRTVIGIELPNETR